MADDWSVASQIKPQTPQDIIAPLTAYSNMQLSQARAREVGLQARQQDATFNARQSYMGLINSGVHPEDAIVKSGLSAVDPSGADQALKNVSQQRDIGAIRNYNPSDPTSLKAGGPALVGAGANVIKTQADTGATLANTQQTQVKTQGEKLQLVGQIGQSFLASDKSPEAWNSSIKMALDHGLISPMQAQQNMNKPNEQLARQWAAAGAQSVDTSGIKEENQGAAKAKYMTPTLSPGQTVAATPAAMAAMGGQPPQASQVSPLFSKAAQSADGFSPQGLARTAQIESSNNPNARNASGASGLFQFMPGTWKQYGQGSPMDPVAATAAAQQYAADNKKLLTGVLGRAPTDAELYLAHQQGGQGAAGLLSNPNAPAAQVVGLKAVLANGGRPDMTAGQFASMWTNKFNQPGRSGGFGLSGPVAGAGPQMQMPPGTQPSPGAQQPMAPAAPIPAPVPMPSQQQGMQQGMLSAPQAPPQPQQAPMQLPQQQSMPSPSAPSPQAVQTGVTAPHTGLAADSAASPLRPVFGGMTVQQQAYQHGAGENLAKQDQEAREAFQGATSGQQNLQQLQIALSKVPAGGGKGADSLLSPGPGAAERLGLAKTVNTALSAVGAAPMFDPAKISAQEESQKITGRLGFDLSRTLGSREAAQVVQQSIALNPGIENTPQGARTIIASLNAGLQRQRDFYQFRQQYTQQHGTPEGSDLAFDRARPVSAYVQDVHKLAAVPEQAIQFLQQHSNDPRATAAFDQQYGPGLSRYYAGQ